MSSFIVNITNTSNETGTVVPDVEFAYTDKLSRINDAILKFSGTGEIKRGLLEVGAIVEIKRNGSREFYGLINDINYLSGGGVVVSASGYEIWLGMENGSYSSSPYTNTASATIFSNVIGESSKFNAGTINSGTNIDFRISPTDSLWNAISNLARKTQQDIGFDYDNLEVDILNHKGSSSSVATLNAGIEIANIQVNHGFPTGNIVKVIGQGEGGTRIESTQSDSGSISTYGSITKVIQDRSITTTSEADKLANAELAVRKNITKIYDFEVNSHNISLVSGDVITLNAQAQNINAEEVRIVGMQRGMFRGKEFMTLQVTNKEYARLVRTRNEILADLERIGRQNEAYDQFQDEYSNQVSDTFVGGAEISVGGGWADFQNYNINTSGNLRGTHINIGGSSAGSIIWQELDMGTNKITSLATPTTDADAATKKYVDDNLSSAGLFTKDVGNNWYKINDANYSLVPNATASGATYNNLGGTGLNEKWASCWLTGDLNADGDVNCNDLSASGIVGGSILNINASSGGNIIAGQLDMSNNKIIGVATPTSSSHAATKGYVDGHWNGSAESNLDMNQYDIVDCDDITCDVISANLINVGGSSSNNYFNGNVDVTGTLYASGKFQLPVGTNLY